MIAIRLTGGDNWDMSSYSVASSTSPVLVLSQHDVFMIVVFLVALAAVIVLQPLILSLAFRRQKNLSKSESATAAPSFFEIDYITWFLIHYGIAALAIVVILILGLDNIIDTSTVAALLGSLFGYVLGSSSKGSQSPRTNQTTDPTKPPKI